MLPSHPLCIYKVAISASSDELKAPIAAFSVIKEGDVASSPSPLANNQRSANRFLFAVGKVLPFASPMHLLCSTERFQRQAGSINRCVFTYKRGRRCFVALYATNKGNNWKQVILSVCKVPSFACKLHEVTFPFGILATIWNHQSTRFYLQKRATLPIALCATNKGKKRKQIVFFSFA